MYTKALKSVNVLTASHSHYTHSLHTHSTHPQIHAPTRTHMHTCTHTHTRTHTHTHARTHARTHAHMRARTRAHTHTQHTVNSHYDSLTTHSYNPVENVNSHAYIQMITGTQRDRQRKRSVERGERRRESVQGNGERVSERWARIDIQQNARLSTISPHHHLQSRAV